MTNSYSNDLKLEATQNSVVFFSGGGVKNISDIKMPFTPKKKVFKH